MNPILQEFEDSMKVSSPVGTSKAKHYEGNDAFYKNFVADVKVLSKGFTLIPFLGENFKKVNNSKICFPNNSVKWKQKVKEM